MSETTDPHGQADAEPQGTASQETTAAEPTPQTDPQGEALKREARKWEARAKKDHAALEALREQVKTLVAPEAAQAVEDQLRAANADLTAARSEALRYRVALAEGLPLDLAARLVGEDEEALVKDAKVLKGLVRPTKGTPDAAAGTTPKDRANGGATNMTPGDALRAALGFAPTGPE